MFDLKLKDFLEDAKTAAENIRREVRSKLDLEEQFPEGSDIGDGIRKIKKEVAKREERTENRRRAPENLVVHGKKKKSGFALADHLFVRRGVYTHHAIYIGNGSIVHYNKCADDGISIHRVSLEEFAAGDDIQVMSEKNSPLKYTQEEAVRRALRRVGETEYHLLDNNCEHFVRWCRSGSKPWDEM